MDEKLEQILLSATGWLTARQIADKGGWRSPAHVGVALRHMEDRGAVVRRTSPTERNMNGTPANEWRHKTKDFGGNDAPLRARKKAEKAPAKSAPDPKQDAPRGDAYPLALLADIRAAAGIPQGKALKPAKLVERIAQLRTDAEAADNARALADKLQRLLDSTRNELDHLRAQQDAEDAGSVTQAAALICLQTAMIHLGEDAVLAIHHESAFVRSGGERIQITHTNVAKALDALATLHALKEAA